MTQTLDFEARGAVEQLFYSSDPEVLIEGGAGSGKTRGVCEYVRMRCEEHRGLRVLFLRKTLKALRQTVLPCWEDEVLGSGHRAIYGTAHRNNRQDYRFTHSEGEDSEVILGGLDDVDKYMSGQFDIIVIFEATDNRDEKKHARLTTRLRNFAMPFQVIICDCNPKEAHHYLNRRANRKDKHGRPIMRRLLSRHPDNARYFHADGTPTPEGAKYMERLESLTGPERDRLLLHKWISAEGLIFPTWDPARHMARGRIDWDSDADMPKWDGEGCCTLRFDEGYSGPQGKTEVSLRWFLGSQDWGYREPGAFGVIGVDKDRNAYQIAEVYAAEKQLDWWAERVLPLVEKYRIRTVFADSAEPRSIDFMNDRLGPYVGRSGNRVFTLAEKDWVAGRDMVEYGLGATAAEQRLWVLEDSLEVADHPSAKWMGSIEPPDADLEARGVWTLEHEMNGYTWREEREGHQLDEESDPSCPDHAIDRLRYGLMGLWRRDQHKDAPPPEYDPDAVYYKAGLDKLAKQEAEERRQARRRNARVNSRVRSRKKRRDRTKL